MKRRKFITIAGLGAALAAVGSFSFISASYEAAAASVIKRELPFLKLDEKGLEKFVTEYSKDKNTKYKLTMKGYSFMGLGSTKSGKINQLVNTYLLSTDFFTNKMDESRVVKYVALYDPYTRPCSNPFSHAFYPQQSEV